MMMRYSILILPGTELLEPIAECFRQGFDDDASQYGLNVSDNRMAGII